MRHFTTEDNEGKKSASRTVESAPESYNLVHAESDTRTFHSLPGRDGASPDAYIRLAAAGRLAESLLRLSQSAEI